MLKFGTPTIVLPLAIKKCTVQTGCTVYIYIYGQTRLHYPARLLVRVKSTETRDELSINLYLQSEINFCSVWMTVNA